jgi:hypothetical protein
MASDVGPEPEPQLSIHPQVFIGHVLGEVLNAARFGVHAPPVPLALPSPLGLIPIKDLSPAIERFRDQRTMLDRANSAWPAVRVVFSERQQVGAKWIPLDLEDGIRPRERRESVEKRLSSGEIQREVMARARRANFDAELTDRNEATRNFMDVLSDFISARGPRSVRREDDDPPSEEFTITTDEGNQEVLFATGYFVSTRQGFGISTPARRKLEWGPYMFGINKRGEPAFSDTVWTVPAVLSIHLTV